MERILTAPFVFVHVLAVMFGAVGCDPPRDCPGPGGATRSEPDGGVTDFDVGQDGGCRVPEPGTLIINEIAIRGPEFVELVNTSNDCVWLTDLTLESSMGSGDLRKRFTLTGGAIMPRGAVAIHDDAQWSWAPATVRPSPEDGQIRFAFVDSVNAESFVFRLVDPTGLVVAKASGPINLIVNGSSVTRYPDLTGNLAVHAEVSPDQSSSSPARCVSGHSFTEGCPSDLQPAAGVEPARERADAAPALDAGVAPEPDMRLGDVPLADDWPAEPFNLVINEIECDQPGADGAEFVEIVNVGPSDVPLAPIVLELVNGSPDVVYRRIRLDRASQPTLEPGRRLVVGSTSVLSTLPAEAITLVYERSIQNGPDGIRIVDTRPAVDQHLIDAVAYGNEVDFDGFTSAPLDSASPDSSLSRCPDGVEDSGQSPAYAPKPSTPGRMNHCDDE